MKRIVLLVAAAAVALPGAAAAKGADQLTILGPALPDDGLVIGPETDLNAIAEQSGFWPAVYAQTPSPLLPGRPTGDLGPRYELVYRMPGPNNDTFHVRQHVYPYASGGPVTRVARGQMLFDRPTTGGWFRAPASLRNTLVALGLPDAAPSGNGRSGFAVDPAVWLAAVLAVLLALATVVALRRRPRPAAH